MDFLLRKKVKILLFLIIIGFLSNLQIHGKWKISNDIYNLVKNKKYNEAIAKCTEKVNKAPKNKYDLSFGGIPENLLFIAKLYGAKGNFKKALKEYKNILHNYAFWRGFEYDIDDIKIEYLFLLEISSLHMEERDINKIKEIYLNDIRQNKKINTLKGKDKLNIYIIKMFVCYKLGKMLYYSNKYDEAIKELSDGLTFFNNNYNSRFNNMIVEEIEYLITLNKYSIINEKDIHDNYNKEEAISFIKEYLNTYSTGHRTDECYYLLSLYYKDKRDYASAIRQLEKIIKSNPQSSYAPIAQFQIGHIYSYNIGNTNVGIKEFKNCYKEYPKTFHGKIAAYLAGHLLFMKGKERQEFEEPKQMFLDIISFYSNDKILLKAINREMKIIYRNEKKR